MNLFVLLLLSGDAASFLTCLCVCITVETFSAVTYKLEIYKLWPSKRKNRKRQDRQS